MCREKLIETIINEIILYSPNLNKKDIKPFIEIALEEIKDDIIELIEKD